MTILRSMLRFCRSTSSKTTGITFASLIMQRKVGGQIRRGNMELASAIYVTLSASFVFCLATKRTSRLFILERLLALLYTMSRSQLRTGEIRAAREHYSQQDI